MSTECSSHQGFFFPPKGGKIPPPNNIATFFPPSKKFPHLEKLTKTLVELGRGRKPDAGAAEF